MANTMYPAMANSPKTELSAAITATDTTIKVVDATKLPAGPNIMTILSGDTSETISYAAVSSNSLTGCVRGLNGTAKAWSTGMKVARTYTAYDHDAFISQIKELVEKTVAATITKAGIVQLSSATSSSDDTKAATPKAIKDTMDIAKAADTKATGVKDYVDGNFIRNIGSQSIELGTLNPTSAQASYIDLHSGAIYSDFDVRIISSGGDGSNGHGLLQLQANDIEFITPSGTGYASRLVRFMVGSGQPEGAINASPGTLYLNTAGGTSTTLYVKEAGGGNSGWKAK